MINRWYPLVPVSLIRRMSFASDTEIAVAHKFGMIEDDEDLANALRKLDPAERAKIGALPTLDPTELLDLRPISPLERAIRDKYFILLIINLYERFFLIKNPRTALSVLVPDFRDSALIWILDKGLPHGVAGISEDRDDIDFHDPKEYEMNIRVHSWLGRYVSELVESELLRTRVI